MEGLMCRGNIDLRMGVLQALFLFLFLPNVVNKSHAFSCNGQDPLYIPHEWYEPGDFFIGGMVSHIHYIFFNIISYGSFEPASNDQIHSASFLRMVPSELLQYQGLVQLLLYFQWRWMGLMATDDESGTYFLRTVEQILLQEGICPAFSERLTKHIYFFDEIDTMIFERMGILNNFMLSTAKVVIVHGETASIT
ncbi:hypothetical protein E2320_003462, partial [Naja naja]